jgi:type 1 glutamine amidotransferase
MGLTAWEMVDETYTMNDVGASSEILLTVDHPKSMRTIAWTRWYGEARVFCYGAGHDNQTWSNVYLCHVLVRGIEWAAGKI